MTPERARELLALSERGGSPLAALTEGERAWIAQQIPWDAPLTTTMADLFRSIATTAD